MAPDKQVPDRNFALELVRVTEAAALADHDDAVHRHGLQDDAHRLDRGTIGAVLVAEAHPA